MFEQIYGFKLKFNNKTLDKYKFKSFEEAEENLELKLLESYDNENFTTIQLILRKYELDQIDEELFKSNYIFKNINQIKNFNIELFCKNSK